MKEISKISADISAGLYDKIFTRLYGADSVLKQRKRYTEAVGEFKSLYGKSEAEIFSVGGRTEICGNHTDHNHGCVLAAGVNLDIIAVAAPGGENIRVKSKGFDEDVVDFSNTEVLDSEKYTSSALIRGTCKGLSDRGFKNGGFCAYTTSDVLKGSGLSSSAAFEVMIGTIQNHFYNNAKIDPVTIAQIAQYSENVYFGKPCGLMDQTACAVGGFVNIDFNNPAKPIVRKIDFDFSDAEHALCIIDTGGNHADLTEDYASVKIEMQQVAKLFGKEFLRDVDEEKFLVGISKIRGNISDRAILRAIHFMSENRRVGEAVEALKTNDFELFKFILIESGQSSFMYNQNIFTVKAVEDQGVSLALALSENILSGSASWRVHGGGFAGTIQAFVPYDLVDEYSVIMKSVFGENSFHKLNIRADGAIAINI